MTSKQNTLKALGVVVGGVLLKEGVKIILEESRHFISKKIPVISLQFSDYYGDCHDVLEYVSQNYKLEKFNSFLAGRFHAELPEEIYFTLGGGRHKLTYRNVKMIIDFNRTRTDRGMSESLTVHFYTKDTNIPRQFAEDVRKCIRGKHGRYLYVYSNGSWNNELRLVDRPLNSVLLHDEKREHLTSSIDKFLSREQWYKENGIPWNLGIMLYGPPGTGKTSLIKAIASQYNKSIYYVPPSALYSLDKIIASVDKKAIVVIEDIDGNSAVKERARTKSNSTITTTSEPISKSPTSFEEDLDKMFGGASLSNVLNAIDGLVSCEGRILIATTNHIEQLDKALLRPGRFDIHMEVGYVDSEIFKAFVQRFYKNETYQSFKIKQGISVAQLQQKVLEESSLFDIIEAIKE